MDPRLTRCFSSAHVTENESTLTWRKKSEVREHWENRDKIPQFIDLVKYVLRNYTENAAAS